MQPSLRELRYVRRTVTNLEDATKFASDIFGLMREDVTETEVMLRSDRRFYSLCLSTELPPAVGLCVDKEEDLEEFAEILSKAGKSISWLEGDDARRRLIKRGIALKAPNGIHLEIVWRHMESGWPYHGTRHTGLNGFSAVQLASTNIAEDTAFWDDIPGLSISDYVGKTQYFSLGGAHHQIAVYPSENDGLLGAIWQVESVDNIMRYWHFLQNRQVTIAHGPGRQPVSNATFVTAKTPDGFLMSCATEMDAPPALGPRQFRNEAKSHCAWGSPTAQPEFNGDIL